MTYFQTVMLPKSNVISFLDEDHKKDVKDLIERVSKDDYTQINESDYLEFAKRADVKICKTFGVGPKEHREMEEYYGVEIRPHTTGKMIMTSRKSIKEECVYQILTK